MVSLLKKQQVEAPATKECGETHPLENCCTKVLYSHKLDAEHALIRDMDKVVFSTMVVYQCSTHRGFHLGHDRYMSSGEVLFRSAQFASSGKNLNLRSKYD